MNLKFWTWPNFRPGLRLWITTLCLLVLPCLFGHTTLFWVLLLTLGMLIIAELCYTKGLWDEEPYPWWPTRLQATAPAPPGTDPKTKRRRTMLLNRHVNTFPVGNAFVNDWMVGCSITATVYLLEMAQFGWRVDAGFLPGGSTLDNLVPVGLLSLVYAGFATAGSLTRPRGIKWGMRDLFWSLLPVGALFYSIAKVEPDVIAKSTWWLMGGAFVWDLTVNVALPLVTGDWRKDTHDAPTCHLTADLTTVAVGSEVTLAIASTNAVKAKIDAVGDVAPNGTVKVRLTTAGPHTFHLTVENVDGATASCDLVVTITP